MKPRDYVDLISMFGSQQLRLTATTEADGSTVWTLVAYNQIRGAWRPNYAVEMGRTHGSHTS